MWPRVGRSSGLLWNRGVPYSARNVWCPVWYVCIVFGSVGKRCISPSHNSVLLPAGLSFKSFVCFIVRSCYLICKSFQLMAQVNFKPQFIICIYLNINQLDAQNFIMNLLRASTCFEHEHMCSSSGGQNCTIQPLVS